MSAWPTYTMCTVITEWYIPLSSLTYVLVVASVTIPFSSQVLRKRGLPRGSPPLRWLRGWPKYCCRTTRGGGGRELGEGWLAGASHPCPWPGAPTGPGSTGRPNESYYWEVRTKVGFHSYREQETSPAFYVSVINTFTIARYLGIKFFCTGPHLLHFHP